MSWTPAEEEITGSKFIKSMSSIKSTCFGVLGSCFVCFFWTHFRNTSNKLDANLWQSIRSKIFPTKSSFIHQKQLFPHTRWAPEWNNPYTWPIFKWVSLFFLTPNNFSGVIEPYFWEVPSFRFGDVYDVEPGSKSLDAMAGRVWIDKKNWGIFGIQSEHLKKKTPSFWILSFGCFFVFPTRNLKLRDLRCMIFETFRLKIFPNTVAMFQESPCTCSLSLLGPPRHVYLFEWSIYSWRVGLFWVGFWILMDFALVLVSKEPRNPVPLKDFIFAVSSGNFSSYIWINRKAIADRVKQSRTGSTYSSLWLH